MSKSNSIDALVRAAAAEHNIKTASEPLSRKVKRLVDTSLTNWGAFAPVERGGALGLENYSEAPPKRSETFDMTSVNVGKLVKGLDDLGGMNGHHIIQVATDCLKTFEKGYTPSKIVMESQGTLTNAAPMSMVTSRSSAAGLETYNADLGLEAFGDDMNRLNSDDRLTMNLTIMRPYDNAMDKMFARVSDSSPIVTIKVPAPEVYNWAATQGATTTSYQRNGSTNTFPLRNLFRNPTPVNSTPQLIVPNPANDTNGTLLWSHDETYYKSNVGISALDLAKNAAYFNGQYIDRTDLVSEGGRVSSIIVAVTATVSSSPVTEYFKLDTNVYDMARFVMMTSVTRSGQRIATFDVALMLAPGITQYNGTASTICAALTDAKIQLDISVTAKINLMTGDLQANGSVNLELKQLAAGTAIGAGTQTMFGTASGTLAAYTTKIWYDEENQRRANLAIWSNYREMQFPIPRSRVYFTEYSLEQEIDENAVAATSSVIGLGNARRGLDIMVNALNDTIESLAYAAAEPELATLNGISEASFASSLAKPTVFSSTIDFSDTSINVMNESTRLVEIHGHFRARLLMMLSELAAQSLMLNHYKPGETVVFKAIMHSTLADIVVGIDDYHPALADREKAATGADYSMVLPNGYRFDVVKSNWDCLEQMIYLMPVIDSDPANILSGGSIRDCGTISTTYTPTNNGSVVRRVASTTREILMITNKVGLMIKIMNLPDELGTIGYNPMPLAADSSDAINL